MELLLCILMGAAVVIAAIPTFLIITGVGLFFLDFFRGGVDFRDK